MDKYIQLRVLGKGSFGSAWLVQRRDNKEQFVAKEVRIASMKPAERESAKREIDMLRTLNHPNITKYVDHFEHHGSLFIVMEYANGGDLYSAIRRRKGSRYTERDILHYFTQLCLALLHLHDRHILHRDLKTQNVFLTKDGVVKLGDFGISTVLRNTFELKRTVCGTPYYFSPELCLNKPYNNKSDMWALGCILYELTTLTHAFDGSNMKALVQKILKGVYPPIHSSYSVSLSNLISAMLQIDPHLRPNVSQVVALPYMRESLSLLQHTVELAHKGNRACTPSALSTPAADDAKSNCTPSAQAPLGQSPSRQNVAARRLEERRRDEQAKALQLARERQLLRVHVERRNRENEERAQKAQELQRAAEIEAQNKRKELDARVQEQRRMQEQRARAQAVIRKQREEEWERNMREQAEENKRRERGAAQLAHEKAEEEALRESNNNYNRNRNNNNAPGGRNGSPPLSAAAAAEIYRDMRRQAAMNKRRMLEDMQSGEAQRAPPAVVRPRNRSPSPPSRPKPKSAAAGDDEEARRRAFWQMRIEAEENRRRALGLDKQDAREVKPQERQQVKPQERQQAKPQERQQVKPQERFPVKPQERPQESPQERIPEKPQGSPRESKQERIPEKPQGSPRESKQERIPEKPQGSPLESKQERIPEKPQGSPLESKQERIPEKPQGSPRESKQERIPEKPQGSPLESKQERIPEKPQGSPRESKQERIPEKPQERPQESPQERIPEKPQGSPRESKQERLPEKPPEVTHLNPQDASSFQREATELETELENEEAAVRRDEDYHAIQTAIGAALTDKEISDRVDFNDEALPGVDLTRFMLDGQTIVLPNVNASDPLMHRIESLRLFLEGVLGEDALVMCYRQMNNIAVDDDEAIQRVADAIPEGHQKFIPVIAQLIVCEDAFNRQLVR